MGLTQSTYAKRQESVPYPHTANQAVAKRFSMTIPATAVLGDIFELGVLPAGCVVTDITLDSDDLDSNVAPALTLDVGLMSGTFGDDDATRTCGAEFFDGSTLGQAGGVERMSAKTGFRVSAAVSSRSIGVKIATAAATAAAGELGMTVTYASA